MPKRTKSYSEWQMNRLARPDAAVSFLRAALADSPQMFLVALRKVAQAHQMAKVAKEAGVQRETLYHALSDEGNPTLSTLVSVLDVVGIRLDFDTKEEEVENASPTGSPAQSIRSGTYAATGYGKFDKTQEFTCLVETNPVEWQKPTISSEEFSLASIAWSSYRRGL